MARPRATQPAYAYHVSGQARVQIDGQRFYLGPHGTPESLARYFALLAEYNANGQRLPVGTETHQADQPITVRCITAEFREHIRVKYGSSAAQTCRFKNLCTLLEDEYGDDPATTFGPRKLAEIRDLFVASGYRKNSHRYAILPSLRGVNATCAVRASPERTRLTDEGIASPPTGPAHELTINPGARESSLKSRSN